MFLYLLVRLLTCIIVDFNFFFDIGSGVFIWVGVCIVGIGLSGFFVLVTYFFKNGTIPSETSMFFDAGIESTSTTALLLLFLLPFP